MLTMIKSLNDCHKKDNCYSCNSPEEKCLWSINTNSCLVSKLSENIWFQKETKCLNEDKLSQALSDKYCGVFNDDKFRKHTLSFPSMYLPGYLFCKWEFDSNNSRSLLLSLKKKTDCLVSIEIHYDTSIIEYLDIKPNIDELFTINFRNPRLIDIYLFIKQSEPLNNYPIEIELSVSSWPTFSEVAIYIVIGFGVCIFCIIMVVLVFCFKKIVAAKLQNTTCDIPLITTTKMTAEMILSDPQCAICRENIPVDAEILLLKCRHRYDFKCLNNWIKKNPLHNLFCPLCHFKFREAESITPMSPSSIGENNVLVNQEPSHL